MCSARGRPGHALKAHLASLLCEDAWAQASEEERAQTHVLSGHFQGGAVAAGAAIAEPTRLVIPKGVRVAPRPEHPLPAARDARHTPLRSSRREAH